MLFYLFFSKKVNLTLEKKKKVSYNIINIHSSSEEEEQK